MVAQQASEQGFMRLIIPCTEPIKVLDGLDCFMSVTSQIHELVKEKELMVANNKSKDPATFVTERLRRVLDMVLVDDLEKVEFFATDSGEEKMFTPFSVKTTKKNGKSRKWADHNALHWGMKIKMCKPHSKLPPVWRMNRTLGKERYEVCTDELATMLFEVAEKEESIDAVVGKLDRAVKDAKFKGYGKTSVSRKRKEKLDEKRIWTARLELVKKLAREFENQKDSIRVWKARTIAIGKGDNQRTSMQDYRSGEMLHDLEEITEMLLDYNEQTMGKSEENALQDEREHLRHYGEDKGSK